MKKLSVVLLGLGLALGSIGVTFAQDGPKMESKKPKKAKKAKVKKEKPADKK